MAKVKIDSALYERAKEDWIITAKTYTKIVIAKFEELMAEGKDKYEFSEFKTPMDKDYHPELDLTPILDAEHHSRFRAMIGSLIWTITICQNVS